MLGNILKEITKISEDINSDDNTDNYLSALNYLDNLYKFISVMQKYASLSDLTFLPSYKDEYLVEKLGILSSAEENEMRLFIVKSPLFLNKETYEKIKSDFSDIATRIMLSDDTLYITIK